VPNRARPRRRPRLHLTAPRGWLNDPHAIGYLDGRYHLFYQHNPHGVQWAVGIHWGHASSRDLVGWTDHGDVLAPDDQDGGCWSGGLALQDGEATLLYTSVQAENPSLGSVRLAHPSPDRRRWTKDPVGAVIGPEAGDLDLLDLRDPFPWWTGSEWTAVQAAGVAGLGGAVVQYRSPDLRRWAYDGVVVSAATAAPGGETDHVAARPDGSPWWSRAMWECPQLFALDGSWVLLLSVGHRHHPGDIVYAVGDYDGRRFTPRSWGPFSHGPVAYAVTTFVDCQGRRCAMSWLRERPETRPDEWAGCLSLPLLLALDGDRLVTSPHPDLTRYRGPGRDPAGAAVTVDLVAGAVEVVVPSPPPSPVSLRVSDGTGAELVHLDLGPDVVRLRVAGNEPLELARSAGPAHGLPLSLVMDADVVEVCGAGTEGAVAVRLPTCPERVTLAAEAAATVYPLVAAVDAAGSPAQPGSDSRPEGNSPR
jgi:beta-fructofuranosidase